MSQHWQAFDAAWFTKHQGILLAILALPVAGKLARWMLRIRRCDVGYAGRIVEIGPHYYIVDCGGEMRTADIRTHPKYAKRVYYSLAPLWWALHSWDWLIADRLVPRLSFGLATLTMHPNPGTSGVADAIYTRGAGAGESWATITTSNATNFEAANIAVIQAHATTDLWQALTRSIFRLDTAVVGGHPVVSATFSIFGSIKADGLVATPDVNLYEAPGGSYPSFFFTDFPLFGTTEFSTAITYAGFSTSGYNNFVLNASGLAGIVYGIFHLGLRNANYDVSGTPPPWVASQQSGMAALMADQAGTTQDPKLVVTFTTSRPLEQPIMRPRVTAPGLAR